MENTMIFDPLAWASQNNANTVNEPAKADAPVKHLQPAVPSTGNELAKATAVADELISRGANIAESYEDYLQLGFALAYGLGEAGGSIYHKLCAQSAKYREGECEKKWQECLRRNDGRTTIASFYKMAQQAGVNLSAISRQFPSNPQNPQGEGNLGKDVNMGIPCVSATFPHGEGSEGFEGNSDSEPDMEDNQTCGFSETFSDKIRVDDLCPMMRSVAATQDDAEGRDKVMLGVLALASGALPNVYGVYDRRRVGAPFYCIIDAPPSADKGVLNSCPKLLEPIEKDIERQNELEQADYQQRMAEYMAKDKAVRAATTPPQEPPYRSLWIPANSSATACYQALSDNYGRGVTFETEADTLSAALKSDYGDFSDGLRKAFHHEKITYNRRKDNEHVKIYNPQWSILLTCTPGQIPTLFPSLENGLGSRFVFYNLNRKLFWRDVFQRSDKTLDEQFLELGHRFKAIYDELASRKDKPIEFLLTVEQQQEFNCFFEGLQFEQVALHGEDLIAFVRRLGLVCFRIAMVLTVLRHEGCYPMFDPLSQSIICADQDFHTAMTIANCLINHTAHVYANLVKHDAPTVQGGVQMSQQETLLFRALDKEFTTADCRQAAQKSGIQWKTAERYLGQFLSKYHTVDRVRNGHYRKR